MWCICRRDFAGAGIDTGVVRQGCRRHFQVLLHSRSRTPLVLTAACSSPLLSCRFDEAPLVYGAPKAVEVGVHCAVQGAAEEEVRVCVQGRGPGAGAEEAVLVVPVRMNVVR
jgi:hypothetical protein